MNKKDYENSDKGLGKTLSYILRHHPEAFNVHMDSHGWVNVDELLSQMRKRGRIIDHEILERIVRENDKKRYSYNENKTKIRANQGHSIKVDVELKTAIPPEYLYHGTAERFTQSIDELGLLHKSRLYVHLSKDTDTARKVGIRHGKPFIYRVKSGEMSRDGYTFFLSENGVWLTETVPVQYLEKSWEK